MESKVKILRVSAFFMLFFVGFMANAFAKSNYNFARLNDKYGAYRAIENYNKNIGNINLKLNNISRLFTDNSGTVYLATSPYDEDFKVALLCDSDGYMRQADIILSRYHGKITYNDIDDIIENVIIAVRGYDLDSDYQKRKLLASVYMVHYNDFPRNLYYCERIARSYVLDRKIDNPDAGLLTQHVIYSIESTGEDKVHWRNN